jgi:hypothetical protein
MDSSGSRLILKTELCKHGNEFSGYIKDGECVGWLRNCCLLLKMVSAEGKQLFGWLIVWLVQEITSDW